MVFSSISFLYYFLPAVLLLYYAVPRRMKNPILLLSSLFFYFCGEQRLVLVMLFSALFNYFIALLIDKYGQKIRIARLLLVFAVVVNISLLCYFKYSDFFIENVNNLFRTDLRLLKIALPIGISFYTFQTMSYTIDVYKKSVKAQKNPITVATYVTFFPQLIAGPIVRYNDISQELDNRKHSISDFSYGVRRFVFGLSKKVLIANTFAELANTFKYSEEKTVLFYWIAAAAFLFQIYFDFSGYSDMAIGLGRMFGFHFPENFNYPYIAKSITEFWRRWHITLSSWFRDYVYIPLGGNRVSKPKWIRNILIVWLLTGFWHGAEWNFILWGGVFAFFLICEKIFLKKILDRIPSFFSHFYTVTVVFLAFVLFNADNVQEALSHLKGMFGGLNISFSNASTIYSLKSYAILFIISVVASTPVVSILISKIKNTKYEKILNIAEPVIIMSMLLLCTGFIIDGSFNPFLYFRF